MTALPRNRVLQGDARTRLAELPTGSVDCVVTSPPYPLVRNYEVAGQIGLESSVTDWVESLRAVMREVARVIKPSGSVWLNVADTYSRHDRYGAPPKSALLAPERLLVALVADGWTVRSKVIWAKTNAMPTSVQDRLANTYEFVYFLVRSHTYYFDLDAIRIPHRSQVARRGRPAPSAPPGWAGPLAGSQAGLYKERAAGTPGDPLGRNPGDCWAMATAGFRGPHRAVFPEALVIRPLLATCPERLCAACGRPWSRGRVAAGVVLPRTANGERSTVVRLGRGPLRRRCGCDRKSVPGVVLDPFLGSGTTAVVACALGRDYIGVELKPAYCRLARRRLAKRDRGRPHRRPATCSFTPRRGGGSPSRQGGQA